MSKVHDRVVLIGVGGATCSGKTTLAKHLRNILPNSIIIHQDDFAPPQELVPIHPIHNVQDWDAPRGAIDWPRLRSFLKGVKESGVIPPDHRSHDHLNEQKNIPLTDPVHQAFRTRFQQVEAEQQKKGIRIIWGLVDGFLLYWDKEVINQLDVRFLLRVPHDILKQRRHERHGYHTAVQLDPEGTLWRDPPNYWEQIVYPAYVDAHKHVFENGDVEHGQLVTEAVPDLLVIEPMRKGAEMDMDDIVRRCYDMLWHFVCTLEA